MKNYIDMANRLDLKRIETDKKRIEKLQAEGKYPLYFSMPTTIQYELTGDCNLKCAHCYNRSGDSDVVRNAKMTPEDWKTLSRQIVKDGGVFQCILSEVSRCLWESISMRSWISFLMTALRLS